MPWFSRLGHPIDDDDRRLTQAYLAALGTAVPIRIEVAHDWMEAERLTRDPSSDSVWWKAEEDERRALMRETAILAGETLLLEALTAAVEGAAEHTHAAALRAGGDEAMSRVASGAALMALHCRALALLAGRGETHLFVQKYALFARGRWPLGMRGSDSYCLF